MVLVELIFQHIHSTLDALVNQTVLFGCGALPFRIVDDARNRIHIAVIQNIVTINLIFQFAELGNRGGVGQHRCGVEWRKGFFHFLRVVHKVHDHDLFIKRRAYTVQAGKRLHCIYTAQLFQHIHGAEFWLVETDLILICHQQDVILVSVKHLRQLILSKAVHTRLGVFGIFNFHFAGERHQRLYILVIMPGDIVLKCLTILHCRLAGCRDNHCFCLPAKFLHNSGTEMLDNDIDALIDVIVKQINIACNLPLGGNCLHLRVVFDGLVQLVVGLVFDIILQHIKDIPLFDGLLHAVQVERLIHGMSVCINAFTTKQAQCHRLGRSSKGKDRYIGCLAVALDFIFDSILRIGFFGTLVLPQRVFDRNHILAGRRRMGFVNDNGKGLVVLILRQLPEIHIEEFLNRGDNDFVVAFQCIGKVGRGLFVINGADKSTLMVDTLDCVLQLAVYHHTVCNDQNAVIDNMVLGIVQGYQPMGQPRNGVGLAGTCGMLNQVIKLCAVVLGICQKLTDGIALMVARENQLFFDGLFPCQFVHDLLTLDKDELGNQFNQAVTAQNIIPHIMHRIIVHTVIQGVAFPGVYTLAAPTVERNKACAKTVQLGGHIAGVEVHSKVDQSTRFEQKQTVLRVTVLRILLDCHAVVLTCVLAFQLKGRNGKAVEEHNKVDALVIVNPDFLHDGENIGIVLGNKVNVVIGGWLTVQQVQMHIGNFNAGFQRFDKAAALVIDALEYKFNDGFLGLSVVDFPQCRHCVRLCRVQKAKQQFAVHGRGAVIIRFAFALYVAVIIN